MRVVELVADAKLAAHSIIAALGRLSHAHPVEPQLPKLHTQHVLATHQRGEAIVDEQTA